MRYSDLSENKAMDKTIDIMKKSFNPERKAVQAKVNQLVRAVQMGKGDKTELAKQMTELLKSEMHAKNNDPDLSVSVDQNIGMLKRAMDKLTVDEGVFDAIKKTASTAVKAVSDKVSSDFDKRNKLFGKGKSS